MRTQVGGFANLQGKQIGSLRVLQRLPGTPWRWNCQCRCGYQQAHRHVVLTSGYPPQCANPNCGKKLELADEWFANIKQQERRAQAAEKQRRQAEIERTAREQQEQAARNAAKADAEAAEKKAKAEAANQKRHAGELELARIAREQEFETYGLSESEKWQIMNRLSPEDLSDIGATKVHFYCLQMRNQ